MGQKYSIKNNLQTSKPWFYFALLIVLLSIIKIDIKNTRKYYLKYLEFLSSNIHIEY
jgi:hypothetical protein